MPNIAAHPSMSSHPDYHYLDTGDESDAMSIDSRSSRMAPSSVTSHDADTDMRSGSPAPSVYSVTSSIRAASYRHEYGRGVNNYSDVYWLPADEEELKRLGVCSP